MYMAVDYLVKLLTCYLQSTTHVFSKQPLYHTIDCTGRSGRNKLRRIRTVAAATCVSNATGRKPFHDNPVVHPRVVVSVLGTLSHQNVIGPFQHERNQRQRQTGGRSGRRVEAPSCTVHVQAVLQLGRPRRCFWNGTPRYFLANKEQMRKGVRHLHQDVPFAVVLV